MEHREHIDLFLALISPRATFLKLADALVDRASKDEKVAALVIGCANTLVRLL
jgi:hypothetical protein